MEQSKGKTIATLKVKEVCDNVINNLSGLVRTRIGKNCVLDTSGDGACGLHA